MENLTITIPQSRYNELLDIETRANVVVERITHDEYIKTEDILRIIGTDEAVKRAEELRAESIRRDEEYRKRMEEKANTEP